MHACTHAHLRADERLAHAPQAEAAACVAHQDTGLGGLDYLTRGHDEVSVHLSQLLRVCSQLLRGLLRRLQQRKLLREAWGKAALVCGVNRCRCSLRSRQAGCQAVTELCSTRSCRLGT